MLSTELHNKLNDSGNAVNAALSEEEFEPRKAYFQKYNRGPKNSRRTRMRRGVHRRGNSFSGRTYSQRVLVKAHYKKHANTASGGGGVGNLKGHLNYITRKGSGKEVEERPELFSNIDDVTKSEFYDLCEEDRHHFRIIISPENASEIDDMQDYVRRVMDRVSSDLETDLSWVSAIHYDTDNPHAHVILRGKDDQGKDLVISSDYISSGIRGRSQEVANELLGERSLEEVHKSMEKEVDALRVTSLDRYIHDAGQEAEREEGAGEVIVIKPNKDLSEEKGAHFDALVSRRLDYLSSTGLASKSGNAYHVNADFVAELRDRSYMSELSSHMAKVVPEEVDRLQYFRVREGEDRSFEGRVERVGYQDEISDKKYILVRDGDDKLHHVAMPYNRFTDKIDEDLIVRVSTPEPRKNGADYNIADEAKANNGVYDPELHKASVYERQSNVSPETRGYISDVETYVSNHVTRMETLEKAGVVFERHPGTYRVPEDLVEQGANYNAEMDRKYRRNMHPEIKALSYTPLHKMVEAEVRTFLDVEIWRHQKGYKQAYDHVDPKTLDAIHKRQEWLEERGYGYRNSQDGSFAMRDDALRRLYEKEISGAKDKFEKLTGLSKGSVDKDSDEKVRYFARADLHSGNHIVVTRGNTFDIVKSNQQTHSWRRGEPLEVEQKDDQYVFKRDMAKGTRKEALAKFGERLGMETKELDIEKSREVNFVGGIILKDSAYALVEHGGKLSLLKTEQYPVHDRSIKYNAVENDRGYAELSGVPRQKELDIGARRKPQGKEQDRDIELE